MTVESMNKAAAELNTELQKAEKPVEQFNAIAGKAGAKTAAYGPFINPNALLSSVNLQNARSQEELQGPSGPRHEFPPGSAQGTPGS